jgi:phage FluMu protein Com
MQSLHVERDEKKNALNKVFFLHSVHVIVITLIKCPFCEVNYVYICTDDRTYFTCNCRKVRDGML